MLQHLVADGGVGLHHRELVGREPAGFLENVVGDADLADVVQRCGQADQPGLGRVQTQLECQQLGVGGNPLDVPRRLG